MLVLVCSKEDFGGFFQVEVPAWVPFKTEMSVIFENLKFQSRGKQRRIGRVEGLSHILGNFTLKQNLHLQVLPLTPLVRDKKHRET